MLRGRDHVRPGDNRRRERYSGPSDPPVSLVPDEDSKLPEVAGFPVAKVTFLNRHASGNAPAKLRLVDESDVDIEETLLKIVFNPVHDFSAQTAILPAGNELTRAGHRWVLLLHGRPPTLFGCRRRGEA